MAGKKCFFDCGTTEDGAVCVCLACHNIIGVKLDSCKNAMECAYNHALNILNHVDLIENEEIREIIGFSANAACNFLNPPEECRIKE